MGRDRKDRESWVQTNTEFHQDWTDKENVGQHIHWKQGLSLETTAEERKRRYKAQVAPRRPRRWFLWLVIFGIAAAAVLHELGYW